MRIFKTVILQVLYSSAALWVRENTRVAYFGRPSHLMGVGYASNRYVGKVYVNPAGVKFSPECVLFEEYGWTLGEELLTKFLSQ